MQLRSIAYFQTGGTSDAFYAPTSLLELKEALLAIKKSKRPLFLLGKGSNSLVMDAHWQGAVLSFARLSELHVDQDLIRCGAGVDNSDLTQFALDKGLAGLGWMHRLPGQIGATVRMNARCYGGEISQVVARIVAFDLDGNECIFQNQSGDRSVFRGYKDTIFMDDSGLVIAQVDLKLDAAKDMVPTLEKMRAVEQDRINKGQFIYPSCGCVFKNSYLPEVSVPSGLLLELAGGKNLAVGRARINPHHANFVSNQGATSDDILELTFAMREAVYKEFGFWMDYEMEILGSLSAEQERKFHEKRPAQYQTSRLTEARRLFAERKN